MYNQVTHGIFMQSIVWLVYICKFVSYSIQYNTITSFKEGDVITFNSFLTLRPSRGIPQSALQLREVKEAVWRKFRQIQPLGMVHQTEWFSKPFSPGSDQNQFSLYDINIQWKEKVGRIEKLVTRGKMLLIFSYILLNTSVRKYTEISPESLDLAVGFYTG